MNNIGKSNDLYSELNQRGFVYQSSSEDIGKIMEETKMTVYVGTDPTADSLHVGHLVPMMMLSHFNKYNHTPILLVGGATGMIGDPSFKNKERSLLTPEQVEYNTGKLASQVSNILKNTGNSNIEIVNNHDWYKNFNILDFLRDVGKYFSVNNMLGKDSVKSRIESSDEGISFTEFTYALLQAYDFYLLHEEKGCNLQIGGSDQWGNIVGGIDLVRKKTGQKVFGLTCPLITKSDGTKFGKSEGGNIWLDPTKTSPYKFYQFWMNISDEEAEKFIKLYTFLPLEEIETLVKESRLNPEKRVLQQNIAREITTIIHGSDTCKDVEKASSILFGNFNQGNISKESFDIISQEVENIDISYANFSIDGIFEALVSKGFFKSKTELKKLLSTDSLSIDGINMNNFLFIKNSGKNKFLLKKGKKNFYLISLI